MKEEWKEIKGFPNYQVSSFGRVKNIKKGSLLCPSFANGYKTTCVCNQGKARHISVHRLVAETFIPNPERKPVVNHKDGNKSNNRVTNLEWVTVSENLEHAYKVLGRVPSALGKRHSKQTKEKMSNSHKGKIVSDKTRERISRTRKGIVFSEEHRRNLSLSHKGHKLTEEQKKKISVAVSAARKKNK